MNKLDKKIMDLEAFVTLQVKCVADWSDPKKGIDWDGENGIRSRFQEELINILGGKELTNKSFGIRNRQTLPNQTQIFKIFEIFDIWVTNVENKLVPINEIDKNELEPISSNTSDGCIPYIEKINSKVFKEVLTTAQYNRLSKNDLLLINVMGSKIREKENLKIFIAIISIIIIIGGITLFLRHYLNKRKEDINSEDEYLDDDVDIDIYDDFPNVDEDYNDIPEPSIENVSTTKPIISKIVKVSKPVVAITDEN